MQYLKADTSTKVVIGPAVAVGDGFTPVTTLSLSTADEAELLKHDAAAVTSISGNTFAAIASADGYYNLTITAAQLDTEGRATVLVNDDSLILPIRVDFMVVNANVYDSLFAAATTDYLQTDVAQWLGTAAATPTTAGVPEVDVTFWSATLGTNDDYPATQAQVGNIAVGSAAIGYNATGFTLTTGTETLTYTATQERDGILHEIAASAGNTDGDYTLTLPGNGVATAVKWAGYIQSNGDSVEMQFYDWVAADYVTENTVSGSNGTTIIDEIIPAVSSYTGTGANLGQVRFRLLSTTSTNIATDRLIFEATVVAQSVGYANGAIWFDSTASNTNTEIFIDGTADNPVSTEVAVNTLISSTGLKRVEVAIDSSITFATTHTGEFWTGEHWVCGLGGQDLSSSHIKGADISGIGTGTTPIDFDNCRIDTATIHRFHMKDCGFDGTLTLGETGDYVIYKGHSAIAGATTPIIDTNAALANVNLTMPDYSNGIEIQNLNAAGTDRFSVSGQGQIIYAASSSGAVNQRGDWKVTNTGGVTITSDDNTANVAAIKTKSDSMTFTKANEIDSNVKSINNVTIVGDGSATPFNV